MDKIPEWLQKKKEKEGVLKDMSTSAFKVLVQEKIKKGNALSHAEMARYKKEAVGKDKEEPGDKPSVHIFDRAEENTETGKWDRITPDNEEVGAVLDSFFNTVGIDETKQIPPARAQAYLEVIKVDRNEGFKSSREDIEKFYTAIYSEKEEINGVSLPQFIKTHSIAEPTTYEQRRDTFQKFLLQTTTLENSLEQPGSVEKESFTHETEAEAVEVEEIDPLETQIEEFLEKDDTERVFILQRVLAVQIETNPKLLILVGNPAKHKALLEWLIARANKIADSDPDKGKQALQNIQLMIAA